MADDCLCIDLRIRCDNESFANPIAQIVAWYVFGIYGNFERMELVIWVSTNKRFGLT